MIGGLYWKRANTLAGYLAMVLGAVGAIVPFFFLDWNENITGFMAFGLAAFGFLIGSVVRSPSPWTGPGAARPAGRRAEGARS